jgi:hypothetical protein
MADQEQLGRELEHYSQTYGVYEQILSLQTLLTQISGIYVVITGGLWTAVVSPELKLNVEPQVVILGLHFLASLWLLPLLIGFTGAIRARFLELERIHKVLLPTIKRFGEESHSKVYWWGVGKWSWGKQRWFWFIFPVIGASGSLILLRYILIYPNFLLNVS